MSEEFPQDDWFNKDHWDHFGFNEEEVEGLDDDDWAWDEADEFGDDEDD